MTSHHNKHEKKTEKDTGEKEEGGILPYIKNNKVYFGRKLQRGEGILSGLLAKVIPLIGGVI